MKVQVLADKESLGRAAAEFICGQAQEAVEQRGRFSLVLSGGSSPLGAYRLLGSPPFGERMPWAQTHLFWGDERCVPLDHGESNYRAAMEALGPPADLPVENIHPMPAYLDSLEGAFKYQFEIEDFFGRGERPAFDLLLLGLGPDGHTASLFPGSPALSQTEAWVAPAPAPAHLEPHLPRITFTLPLINSARTVLFLTAGEGKADVVHDIMYGTPRSRFYPAARVDPQGELIWLMDAASTGGV